MEYSKFDSIENKFIIEYACSDGSVYETRFLKYDKDKKQYN